MSLTVQDRYAIHTGSDSTGPFSFSFSVTSDDDLVVIRATSSGVEVVLELDVDYTVTGAGSSSGGSVTLTETLASGETLVILGGITYTQPTVYTNNTAFTAVAHNSALDRIVTEIQQLYERARRSPAFRRSAPDTWRDMRIPDPKPLKVIGFDATGLAMKLFDVASTPLTITNPLIDCLANHGNSLTQAISDIGDTHTLLMLEQPVSLTENVVVPHNIHIWIPLTCVITCNGYSITFLGPCAIASGKVFETDGTVRFGDGAVDHVSPLWWGAGAAGSGDSTAACIDAVSCAYAGGHVVYWAEGDYDTTTNIPYFHSVRHRGPGRVIRGTDTFYPEPVDGITNTLYVAADGVDTNDGLSASEPLLTTQAAGDAIYGYPSSDATWAIQHAAGTYTQSTVFTKPWPSNQRVQFLGAPVANGVEPTTIFACPDTEYDPETGTGNRKYGIRAANGAFVYVEDIYFQDYALSGTPVSANGCFAVIVDEFCDLYTQNVWIDNCDGGIVGTAGSRVRVKAGKVNGCAQGLRFFFNTNFSVGYGGTACSNVGDTGVVVTNCTGSGFVAQEGCTGHIDYTWFEGNNIGVKLQMKSHAHILGSQFYSNSLAFTAGGNCTWYNNPGWGDVSLTVTASASTNKFTSSAHGLANGTAVTFTSTEFLPEPILEYAIYYVVNTDTNDFKVASTVGGSAIDLTSDGSGTITVQDMVEANKPVWDSTNTNQWGMYAGSVETCMDRNAKGPAVMVYRDPMDYSTSSTSEDPAFEFTFPAPSLRSRGSGWKLEMWGRGTGASGWKRILVSFGGSSVFSSESLIGKPASGGSLDWHLMIECVTVTGTGASPKQKCVAVFQMDGVSAVTVHADLTLDMADNQKLLVSHLVQNASDTSTINVASLSIVH